MYERFPNCEGTILLCICCEIFLKDNHKPQIAWSLFEYKGHPNPLGYTDIRGGRVGTMVPFPASTDWIRTCKLHVSRICHVASIFGGNT